MLHLTLKVELITIEGHLLKVQMKCFFFIPEFQRAAKIRKIAVYLYKIALANIFSSHEMTVLNNKLDTGEIDSAVDQVSDIFISAANGCLTKIRRKKKRKKSAL